MEELVADVMTEERGNLRLQYQDKDFGDIFVNLTSTGELQDLGSIKVIPLPDEDAAPVQTEVTLMTPCPLLVELIQNSSAQALLVLFLQGLNSGQKMASAV